eukprot:9779968-Ditylum_brightwellii.AAC.1
MRPALEADGTKYYEFVLLYTNNVLMIYENGGKLLCEHIRKYFELKKESIGPPKIYLGGEMCEVILKDDVCAWAFGSLQYVKAAIETVEGYLEKVGSKLLMKAKTQIQTLYQPELVVSDELDVPDAEYFQLLIGILCWMAELEHINICLEVSMLSSHLKYHNSELIFDPSVPEIDKEAFVRKDWSSSEYEQVSGQEELPPNMIDPIGLEFLVTARVDADHA